MTGENLYSEACHQKNTEIDIENKTVLGENVSSRSLSSSVSQNFSQLRLSENGVSQLPSNLPSTENINFVDFSRNNLKEVPSGLEKLKNVRELNLSHNELTRVPDALFDGLYAIRSLDISHNKLVTFQKAPSCLPMLQTLDLSHNKLVAPPPWLLEDLCTVLYALNLSHNPLFDLSPRYSQSKNMFPLQQMAAHRVKSLCLVNCGLRHSDTHYISFYKNLAFLDISNETITKISSNLINDFSDIPILPESLEELIVRNVSLPCFPRYFANLKNLRVLDISDNNINFLPSDIGEMSNLTVFRADNAKLYLIPELKTLKNLKELYLKSNEISCADGIEELTSLEVLDLYNNQFMTVPDFQRLSNLKALDFCQNYVEIPELIKLGEGAWLYKNLRECLRSSFCKRNSFRISGAKEFPSQPDHDDYDRFSSYSDSRYEYESGDECAVQSMDTTTHEKELWDVDSNENFDPTETKIVAGTQGSWEPEEQMTGQTPLEVLEHPHYFLPFRTTSPSRPPADLGEPEAGQFDDADQ